MVKRKNGITLVVILVITSVLIWCRLTNYHNWGGDFAAYIMQAQSIVRGTPTEFVTANRFTMEESTRRIGPVAYPWGFPVLLAPFYAVFELNMVGLKSINIICYLLFLVTLWFGFRRFQSALWKTAFVCLFALNPYLLLFMDNVLSDIPYLFLSTLSVILIGNVVVERRQVISKIGDPLLLGTLIALSFFVRTNGILLLVSLGVTQFIAVMQDATSQPRENTESRLPPPSSILSRIYRTVYTDFRTLFLPYICFGGCVLVWQSVFPGGDSFYASKFSGMTLDLIQRNIHYHIELPVKFLLGVPHAELVFGVSIPLVVAGVRRRFGTDYHIVVFGVLNCLLFVFWQEGQGLRYLFPLLPFYMSFMLAGIEGDTAADKEPRRWWSTIIRIMPVVVLIFLFGKFSAGITLGNLMREPMVPIGPYASTSKEVFSFISKNTDPHSIIVFFKPRVMRLFTNRQSLIIDRPSELKRGDYLCLYLRSDAYHQIKIDDIGRLLENNQMRLVYRNVDFNVYRIVKTE